MHPTYAAAKDMSRAGLMQPCCVRGPIRMHHEKHDALERVPGMAPVEVLQGQLLEVSETRLALLFDQGESSAHTFHFP